MVNRFFAQMARGFAMGASDVVPGVSGGTVALILGIYKGLISNIGRGSKALGRLCRGDLSGFANGLKSVDWMFLIPLLLGLASAIVILSGLIEDALINHAESMAGLFFGLVIGSMIVARALLKEPNKMHAVIALAVAIVLFFVLGFQSGPVSDPSAFVLVLAGALASCALILPGISGSFILLMIGMYAIVLNAVDERIISEIALIGIGAIIGLAIFSSFLNHVLDTYHDTVMAILLGLMLGSLRVLWPWPNGVGIVGHDDIETVSGTGLGLPTGAPTVLPIVLAVVAAVLVVALSYFAPSETEGHDELELADNL